MIQVDPGDRYRWRLGSKLNSDWRLVPKELNCYLTPLTYYSPQVFKCHIVVVQHEMTQLTQYH